MLYTRCKIFSNLVSIVASHDYHRRIDKISHQSNNQFKRIRKSCETFILQICPCKKLVHGTNFLSLNFFCSFNEYNLRVGAVFLSLRMFHFLTAFYYNTRCLSHSALWLSSSFDAPRSSC